MTTDFAPTFRTWAALELIRSAIFCALSNVSAAARSYLDPEPDNAPHPASLETQFFVAL
ncbi:MAG TPA: hypothetical protein VGJ60_09045 [Chloroflexota bacterium]|jgi:hypothetical protein